MPTLLFAAVTFLSTLLGGLFALRFRERLHLIVAFAAGVRLGATFFDLLPESLRLGDANHIPVLTLMTAAVLGLLTYHLLEGTILLHSSSGLEPLDEGHRHVGILGAAGFSAHSFLDGVSIGLAFQAGYEAGILVAAAVIAHDFSDGLNTVTILLRNRASAGLSYRWLLVDATTPRDQFHIHYGSRILSKRLREAGISHVCEEFDDNHSDIDYRMDVSLPFLYRAQKP